MLGQGHAPELLHVSRRHRDGALMQIVQHGQQTMPAITEITAVEQSALVDFFHGREAATRGGPAMDDRPNYFFYAFKKILDHEGRPGGKPPWGTLTALNLNTGRIDWSVPLGEYAELTAKGVPQTGTENFGGATVTAGGLVFCAGARDGKIRAFDIDAGQELWEHELPFGGNAPPAVYEADGRQYVVIIATGGGKLGGETGDAYVAFALPKGKDN
jgi:quinoprotein glucose dehydrogenase